MTTVKKAASNYTSAMEARIASETVLNQAVAAKLAAEFGLSTRSVVAKITRMGLKYDRKVPTTKTGAPVENKEKLVAEIARFVVGNLDGLEKAPKPALQALRDALAG